MLKRILIFVQVILCFSVETHSQEKLDSLLSELAYVSNDSNKVKLYIDIVLEFEKIDLKKALQYAMRGLEIADSIHFLSGEATLYNNIGIIYKNQGFYDQAFEHLSQSLRIRELMGDSLEMAFTNNNIGNLYNQLGEYEQALNSFSRGLNIHKSFGYKHGISSTLNNIGTTYFYLGNYDLALNHYLESLELAQEINFDYQIAICYLNIGEVYEHKGNYNLADSCYSKGYNIAINIDHKYIIIEACIYIGKLNNRIGNFEIGKYYLDKAVKMAVDIGSPNSIINAAKSLSYSFRELGQKDSVIFYTDMYGGIKDRLQKEQMAKKIAIIEMNNLFEKERAVHNQELKRRKLINNFYYIASSLGLLLTFFIYRNYRIKRKANKLLAEMDELKSRLFSNISHEFRTPLTLILGPLEEMMEMEKEKKPRRKTVKMMQRNANRLLNLVNQMLDLSKLDAGSMKLELVEGDLIKSLKLIILSFASLAEQKKIKFIYTFPEEKWTTCFDQDKLEKILNNLLSNAFKYTPEEGEVKCVVKMPDPGKNLVEISIQDTGKGIPTDQLDKIFDRFHQVEESYELETVGTGIGLSLTKELVNLLHGDIKVESDLGKGTSFIIRLPVGKEHLKESEYILVKKEKLTKPVLAEELEVVTEEEGYAEDVYEETKPEEEFPLVLTVEDHADIRTHIREHLEDSFRIIEAEDGVAGLDKAIENIPDLVITDLMMPKMDGVEMCKKLKTDERTSHIPVLMLTAKASVEDRVKGLETGADAYVTKPFNIKELRVRVTKLIEQRKKLRERFSRNVKLEPKDIAITSADEKFLNRAISIIEEKMGDFEFDAQTLQQEMTLSRSQLFRKLKALTDLSITEFIRTIRLKRGAKLLEQKFGNVAQVTYEVGFNNLSYFAKCFKELYGVSPSEYVKRNSSS